MKVSLVDVVDCFVLLCQFLIRPVWRKISIYGINLNFIIQKSKLRRNYRDEIEQNKLFSYAGLKIINQMSEQLL